MVGPLLSRPDRVRMGHPFRVASESRSFAALRMTSAGLISCGEGQQGDVAGLLDRLRQTALVRRAHASQTARNDLAALNYKLLQQSNVAVRNRVDLFGAELADLLAAEELASARATGT